MKIEPKGSTPATDTKKGVLVYHLAGGIGRNNRETRQGKLGFPLQCRPKMVPTTVSGSEMSTQISYTLITVPIGMASMVP